MSSTLAQSSTHAHEIHSDVKHINPSPPRPLQTVPGGARQRRGSAGRADGHLQPAVRQLHPAAAAAGASTGQRGGKKGRWVGGMCWDGEALLQIYGNRCIFRLLQAWQNNSEGTFRKMLLWVVQRRLRAKCEFTCGASKSVCVLYSMLCVHRVCIFDKHHHNWRLIDLVWFNKHHRPFSDVNSDDLKIKFFIFAPFLLTSSVRKSCMQ